MFEVRRQTGISEGQIGCLQVGWGWELLVGCWFGEATKLLFCPQSLILCVICLAACARAMDGVISLGLIPWMVVVLAWCWLASVGYLDCLCPGFRRDFCLSL